MLEFKGVLPFQGGIGAQLEIQLHARSFQAPGAQPVMQDGGHRFVGIGTDSDGHVIHLSFLALEYQGVGFFSAFQVISDGLEGIGAIDVVQQPFDGLPVIQTVVRIIAGYQEIFLLLLRNAREPDILDAHFPEGQVDGGRTVLHRRHRLPGHFRGDGFENFLVGDGILISLVNDIVHALGVEGQHRISFEVMMDMDAVFVLELLVQNLQGRPLRTRSQQGDGLHEEVRRRVELVQLAVDGHVRSDDDVRSHFPGDIHREIVPHASIQENFAILAHSPEIEWNRHRGTQGVGDAAGSPVLGRHGIDIRRDAGIGDRQVRKAQAVLVTYAHAAEHVPDIQAEQVAVGHAHAEPGHGLIEHVGRVVPGFRRHLLGDAFILDAFLQILVVVVMRDTDHVLVPVFPEFVADELIRDFVRHHDGPLDGAHQRIQLVVPVTQGVQAAHQAAHAGSRDQVPRDTQLLHILDDAQVRETAGAAAGENEAHRRPVLPDRVHPGADLGEGDGIRLRSRTGKYLGAHTQGENTGEDKQCREFFHGNKKDAFHLSRKFTKKFGLLPGSPSGR